MTIQRMCQPQEAVTERGSLCVSERIDCVTVGFGLVGRLPEAHGQLIVMLGWVVW